MRPISPLPNLSSTASSARPGLPVVFDRLRRGHVAPALVLGAMLLSGCAGMQDPTGLFGGSGGGSTPAGATPAPAAAGSLPARTEDAGPAAATAVVESSYTLDGAILPVARGQTRVETRADRQRTDSVVTFDNWLFRQMAGDGRTAGIVRLDRQLVWDLDLAKRLYTECPLTGCASGKAPAKEQPEQPAKPAEPTCPVTLKTNELVVDATGERRNVNGFDTERYRATWTLDIEDGKGGRNSNRVQMDLWTTPQTAAMRDAQAIEEQFGRRYATVLARGDGPFGRYLPDRVTGAMSMLANRIDTKDRRTMERWAAEFRKVRGYPIVTTLGWTTQGSVCGGAAGGQPTASGIGAALGGLLGGGKSAGSAPAPLISFSQEVKSVSVKPVADSVFMPPADFQRRTP